MINAPFSFIQFTSCNEQSNCKEVGDFFLQLVGGDVVIMQLTDNDDYRIDLETQSGGLLFANIATFQTLNKSKIVNINIPANLAVGCYRLKLKGYESVICDMAIGSICAMPIGSICNLGSNLIDIGCFGFKITKEVCYNKIVTYRCNESNSGFDYSEGFFNQIRLPIRYDFPQTKTKAEIYRRSDGGILRLANTKNKEYFFETDYADEHFHDCVSTMLDADVFIIDGKSFIGAGDYEVGWIKEINSISLAKGTGKITLTPFNNQNPTFI